jgi:acetylornithine/succinyldiaminopimelate/putrescine aminotransferase
MDKTLQTLAKFESQNVTYIEPDGSWPIVWERAKGMYVWDAAGKKYLDLTAAFGVAAAGHANAAVVRAGQRQMKRLLHAMGDVHPHPLKAELVRKLSEITFEKWSGGKIHGKTVLGNSGFEAVEAALKTAMLATGKSGVITFSGGYHGLGYGALNTTSRPYFSQPFRRQLRRFTKTLFWPEVDSVWTMSKTWDFGAVLIEPIQARGGIRIPPADSLAKLRDICDERRLLLILDEVYTGFGRTGEMFACEHSKIIPDLICLGKALTGGFPLSACVGKAELMDRAWPRSHGEALHTSTFLGHPVGCAMALAQIEEVKKLLPQCRSRGKLLFDELKKLTKNARGVGLMTGIDVKDGMQVVKALLAKGIIVLPEGDDGNVVSFTPPLIISEAQIRQTTRALAEVL